MEMQSRNQGGKVNQIMVFSSQYKESQSREVESVCMEVMELSNHETSAR